MIDRVLRHLSYANVVSTVCLFIVLGGSAVAASHAFNGKKIKNRTIPGKKLKKNSITGTEVNEAKLGVVSQAAAASQATNAGTLGGLGASAFMRSNALVAFSHTTTASNTSMNETCLDNPATNGHPKALVLATHYIGTSGSYSAGNNPHPTGVEYNDANGTPANRWCIVNEDNTPMPTGTWFFVLVRP